ncbi:DUF397 domain-containing protein [Streptomyces sp. NPDC050418]|uniref:DUF397 domain-containing protein n=1 Tax=Streptomyces sp. NPDC050418 TaxID=3365612 RepID=UPI0037A379EF
MNWQKSSYCGEGESCVHVAREGAVVLLTESADPSGAVHRIPPHEFARLVADIKSGANQPLPTREGTVHLGPVTTTAPKWHAFQQGVLNSEFDHLTHPA